MKKILILLLLLGNTWYVMAQHAFKTEILASDLKAHVEYLASDQLAGRYPGSPGDHLAADYLRNQFRAAGLELLGDKGLQPFEMVAQVAMGKNNRLGLGKQRFVAGTDFVPLVFSANGKASAQVVFCGYGIDLKKDSLAWNDFEGVDLRGKIALFFTGVPNLGRGPNPYEAFGALRQKAMAAQDRGAVAVLLVHPPSTKTDALTTLTKGRGETQGKIPVLHIGQPLAQRLFAAAGKDAATLEKTLTEGRKPASVALATTLDLQADVRYERVRTYNVLGLVRPQIPSDEYLVLGAHYDHLGLGGHQSGSRQPDTTAVHNGADDNASGTALLLELAAQLAASTGELKRNILFIGFGAEEQGLLGSAHFVEQPIVPLAKVQAMLNFDMVGRLNTEQHFAIGGTGTAATFEPILDSVLRSTTLKLDYSKAGFGPSDHASFYTKDVPVLFFSTGGHDLYHTPADDPATLNYDGMQYIGQNLVPLVLRLNQLPERLAFQEAGPKNNTRGRMGLKVRLGIMPGYSDKAEGVRVDGVSPGAPAEAGGVRKGDVIVGLNNQSVANIQEYMARMALLNPGDRITVDIVRQGQKMVFILQL